jgi:hypothetical protein
MVGQEIPLGEGKPVEVLHERPWRPLNPDFTAAVSEAENLSFWTAEGQFMHRLVRLPPQDVIETSFFLEAFEDVGDHRAIES